MSTLMSNTFPWFFVRGASKSPTDSIVDNTGQHTDTTIDSEMQSRAREENADAQRDRDTLVCGYVVADEILGDDFISPQEIAIDRELTYSDEQINELECTLPDRETLEWLRCNDFYLVAGPPCEMSLLDVCGVEPGFFYGKMEDWYANQGGVFACNEKVTCRWYMLRKGFVPRSSNKTWDEQEALLLDLDMVPLAVELVWGLTCYKAVRIVSLLEDGFVRTSSVASDGRRVSVGENDAEGFGIERFGDCERAINIGLSSSRES